MHNDQTTAFDDLQKRINSLEKTRDEAQVQIERLQQDSRFQAFGEQYNVLEERVYLIEKTSRKANVGDRLQKLEEEHAASKTSVDGRLHALEQQKKLDVAATTSRLAKLESDMATSSVCLSLAKLEADLREHRHLLDSLYKSSEAKAPTTGSLSRMLLQRLERGEVLPVNMARRLSTVLGSPFTPQRDDSTNQEPVKRKPGRPRKHPRPISPQPTGSSNTASERAESVRVAGDEEDELASDGIMFSDGMEIPPEEPRRSGRKRKTPQRGDQFCDWVEARKRINGSVGSM